MRRNSPGRLALMLPVRRILVLLLAALGLAAAQAPAAGAAPGMEVALQDDAILVSQSYFDRARAFDLMRPLMVSRVRMNAIWHALNGAEGKRRSRPSRPAYNFSPLDQAIDIALSQGLKIEVSITGPAPAWANGKRKKGNPFRPNARLYGQFVRTVAKRYAGKVDAYSIWNEPNHVGWLTPLREQAQIYRKLYEQGFKAIRATDPDAKVLIGETAPYASKKGNATPPLRFLREVACVDRSYRPVGRCRPLEADGYAHHPYDFKRKPTQPFPGADSVTIASLDRLVVALNRLARGSALEDPEGSALDIWLTEYGYFARRETGREKVFPESLRARYLKQAFEIAQRNPRVVSMLQYLLVEYPKGMFRFNTAIVEDDGTPMRTYRSLASWAKRARARGQIAAPGPITAPVPGGGEAGGKPGGGGAGGKPGGGGAGGEPGGGGAGGGASQPTPPPAPSCVLPPPLSCP